MTKKNRMPLVMLAKPGEYNYGHAYCEYCAEDAVWFHWAESKKDRDYFACNEHVGNLNETFTQEWQDESARLTKQWRARTAKEVQ
jgi:hypothetical protein